MIAAFLLLGVGALFSESKYSVMRGVLLVISALLYIGLARWSNKRPFTAFLISLILLVSYVVVNTWGDVKNMFANAAQVYVLLIEWVLIYFLVQGVKAAWRADILEKDK